LLPDWAAAQHPGMSVGRAGPAILSKSKTVFVVDDDPGMLRGVRRLLKQHGYDSVLFSSADAFHKHDNFEQAICVILDINLNDGSGIEVRHRLKAAGIFLPVIFITGNDNPATRMAAMDSGCLAYLTKPFVARSLIEPIEQLSAGRA
jgi:FixJ family two-component response regulator